MEKTKSEQARLDKGERFITYCSEQELGEGKLLKSKALANKGSAEPSFRKPMHIHIGVGLFTILSMPSCSYIPEHARK